MKTNSSPPQRETVSLTPPSQTPALRSSGATREVDDAIRSPYATVTEDEKLLQQPGGRFDDFTRTDPWRVLRITSEFIEGFDTLADVQKGVTVFGSARTGPDDPQYQSAQEVARLLAQSEATSPDQLDDFIDVARQATLLSPAYTIQGGTTQILRGIIARGLGLR
jgi:hypothetical protein